MHKRPRQSTVVIYSSSRHLQSLYIQTHIFSIFYNLSLMLQCKAKQMFSSQIYNLNNVESQCTVLMFHNGEYVECCKGALHRDIISFHRDLHLDRY